MNVLSLFSGIGGLDIALEKHGCTTVAYSDVNEYSNKIMARHFPDAESLGDITKLKYEVNENGTTYIEQSGTGEGYWLPPIDIICGGFPCQDISAAWNGPGITGKRSGLWSNYADAIRGLRPSGILVENVASITKRGLDTVLGDLARLGYDAEWSVLRASQFGATHERKRMFLLAYPNSAGLQEQRRSVTATAQQLAAERHGQVLADRPPTDPSVATRAGGRTIAAAWSAEPSMDRVVDGLSHRVDRLRALGNAVVPQVAEHVAGILIERLKESA